VGTLTASSTWAQKPAPGKTPPPAPASDQPKAWKPDKAILAKLSPETRIDVHILRPPKGYAMRTSKGINGSRGYNWESPSRNDGRSTEMTMSILIPPRGDTMTTEDLLAKLLTIP
jgi:hypothetical protein